MCVFVLLQTSLKIVVPSDPKPYSPGGRSPPGFGLLDMCSDRKLNNSTLVRVFGYERTHFLYYHGVPEKIGWVQPPQTSLPDSNRKCGTGRTMKIWFLGKYIKWWFRGNPGDGLAWCGKCSYTPWEYFLRI